MKSLLILMAMPEGEKVVVFNLTLPADSKIRSHFNTDRPRLKV